MSLTNKFGSKGKAALARVGYIAPASHSHTNLVILGTINQNMATTDNVTFNSLVATTTIQATTSVTTADLFASGTVKFTGLPISDPLVVGQLWNNAGVLTISAG